METVVSQEWESAEECLIEQALEAFPQETQKAGRLACLAQQQAEQCGDRHGTVLALHLRARVCRAEGLFADAIPLLQHSLTLCREGEEAQLEGATLALLSVTLDNLGDTTAALEYNLRAIPLSQITNDTETFARALSNTGANYATLGDYAASTDYFAKALEVARQHRYLFFETVSLRGIAFNLLNLKEYDSSLNYCQQALSLAKTLGRGDVTAEIHRVIANVYLFQEKYDDSREHYDAVYEIAMDSHLGVFANVALIGKGQLWERQNDPLRAQEMYQEAYRQAVATDYPNGQVEALKHLGILHWKQGEDEKAEVHLRECLAIAERLETKQEILDCYQVLVEICETTGRLAEALQFHKRFHTLDKDVFSQEAHRRMVMVTTRLETERVQREADTIRLQNERLEAAQQELQAAYAEKSYLLSQLQQQQEQLQRLATVDGLTGLFNRRHFEEVLKRVFDLSREQNQPITVAIGDIDNFKHINDRFGHPVGDTVLRRVGKILQNSLRGTDVVARYGGEEFAILLPGTPGEAASVLLNRLCRAIAEEYWQDIRPDLAVTISIGYCDQLALPDHNPDPDDDDAHDQMMTLADHSLYVAKAAGKNRVVG